MMQNRLFSTSILLFLLIGILSCNNDKDDPEPAIPILTLNFTDKFIPDQIPVIVFISEPDGKIILDTTCNSNGTYVLYAPAGRVIPQKMMVTVVSSELFWHNLIAHINTYTGIDKGVIWTLQGTKPDTITSSHISLENVPVINGPILYSGSGFYNMTFNPTNRSILNYKVPDDLYVKIQTEEGHFYKFEEDLLIGGNYNIDMSNALSAESQSVTFPFQVENYEAKLYAFEDDNYDFPLPVLADYVISDGMATNAIHLNYPPGVFSGFHTGIMIQETYSSDISWFYQTEGDIPDQFLKAEAAILSTASQPGKLTVETSGSFDMVSAHWQFIDHALVFYEWQAYASDTTKTMILPEIPPAFLRMFPTISLDSINFQFAELTEFQQLDGYDVLINKLFDPLHPTQMNRYEASSVRKSVIPAGKK
jgi:hypothetical protein